MKLLIINGPNINLLGKREPSIYGTLTYDDLIKKIHEHSREKKIDVEFFQSNSEGDLVEKIQNASQFDGIVINAAAYTHTSVALRDALAAVGVPFVEVHISNVFAREEFRHKSLLSDKAIGVITGFGIYSYIFAVDYFCFKSN